MQKMAENDRKPRPFKGKIPHGAKVSETKGEKPWWRTEEKPLDLSKISNPRKYIETGKK